MLHVEGGEVNDEVAKIITESLQFMVQEAKEKIRNLKNIKDQLVAVQDCFFKEIKYTGDKVGISMPESSEVDLLEDDTQNPLQVIEAYQKSHGIKTNPETVKMLQKTFAGVEPILVKREGGSEYQAELVRVLEQVCQLKQEEIHISDAYRQTKEYADLISSL